MGTVDTDLSDLISDCTLCALDVISRVWPRGNGEELNRTELTSPCVNCILGHYYRRHLPCCSVCVSADLNILRWTGATLPRHITRAKSS